MSTMAVTGVSPVQGGQRVQGAAPSPEEIARQLAQGIQAGQVQTLAEGAQEAQDAGIQQPEDQSIRRSDPLSFTQDNATTLIQRMIEAQKKAKEMRDKFKIPKNTRYGDYAIEAYARLSRARRQSDVSAAAGYARRQIVALRAAKRQDSENAPRIQAAINQLERAVIRAGKKSRDLEREQLSEMRQKRLEKNNQQKEAQRLRQELRRRQALRKLRERGYIKEAVIDNHHQEQMAATRAEYRAQLENLASTTGDPAVQQQYLAQMAADGTAPVSTPELSIEA